MSWKDETHEKLVEMEKRVEEMETLLDKIWRVMTGYGLKEEPFGERPKKPPRQG